MKKIVVGKKTLELGLMGWELTRHVLIGRFISVCTKRGIRAVFDERIKSNLFSTIFIFVRKC